MSQKRTPKKPPKPPLIAPVSGEERSGMPLSKIAFDHAVAKIVNVVGEFLELACSLAAYYWLTLGINYMAKEALVSGDLQRTLSLIKSGMLFIVFITAAFTVVNTMTKQIPWKLFSNGLAALRGIRSKVDVDTDKPQ
jgi:hypothetical protein